MNASGRVTQVEKVAFAHVAMRGDAAGDTKRFTFFKLLAHLRDRAANIKAGAERLDAFRAQRSSFFRLSAISSFSSSIFGQRM